jgi:hypothetical protein
MAASPSTMAYVFPRYACRRGPAHRPSPCRSHSPVPHRTSVGIRKARASVQSNRETPSARVEYSAGTRPFGLQSHDREAMVLLASRRRQQRSRFLHARLPDLLLDVFHVFVDEGSKARHLVREQPDLEFKNSAVTSSDSILVDEDVARISHQVTPMYMLSGQQLGVQQRCRRARHLAMLHPNSLRRHRLRQRPVRRLALREGRALDQTPRAALAPALADVARTHPHEPVQNI